MIAMSERRLLGWGLRPIVDALPAATGNSVMRQPGINGIGSLLLMAVMALANADATTGTHQQQGETMPTIRIIVDDGEMIAELDDNAAARDFLALLPLTLQLDDYAATEKVADLPKKLSTAGTAGGFDPSVGDITYYAPWGNLAIFYKDFSYSRGLVNLGRIVEGQALLHFRGRKTVTIEPVPGG